MCFLAESSLEKGGEYLMKYKNIIFEKEEKIATITLNRPEKLNAETAEMMEELIQVFYEIERDEEVRVAVITGAGRAFCAGADVKDNLLAKAEEASKGILQDVTKEPTEIGCSALMKVSKPVIASVNGVAVGFGCTLAIACDIRIASEKAKFSLALARVGLLPEWGSTFLLPRLVGIGKACQLAFTAKTINAREAKEIGLVNEVVEHEALKKTTYDMARTISSLAPLSLRLSKRALYQGISTCDMRGQLQYEGFAMNYLRKTQDHQEGVNAFIEKRSPVFKGM